MNKLSNCSTPSPVSKSLWVTAPSPKPSGSRGRAPAPGVLQWESCTPGPFSVVQVSVKAFTCLPSLSMAPRQPQLLMASRRKTVPALHLLTCQAWAHCTCLCAYRHIHFQLLSLPKIHFEKFFLKLMLSRAA